MRWPSRNKTIMRGFHSRYDLPGGDEMQAQSGSAGRVLRNRLGFIRKQEIDQAEYEALLLAQDRWLGIVTAETRFTAEILCRMHQDWLGSIYDWAGRYRSVDLTKDSFTCPPATRVAANMKTFEETLLAKWTPCVPNKIPAVAEGIARVHADLLLIHPFREGNGRLSRWLADLMAAQASLPPPDYGFKGRGSLQQKAKYLAAVKAGYNYHTEDLTAFFVDAL